MNQVCSRIFIGDENDAAALGAGFGNTEGLAVVSAQMNDRSEVRKRFTNDGNRYLWLRHADCVPWNTDELLTFLAFTRQCMDANLSVLVQCGAGISRSSSLVIAWLMHHGWSWDQAEDLVRAARPIIQPHHELKTSILEFFDQVYKPIGA